MFSREALLVVLDCDEGWGLGELVYSVCNLELVCKFGSFNVCLVYLLTAAFLVSFGDGIVEVVFVF